MSPAAVRQVMSLMKQGLDEDLGAAFYELLLQTSVLVPLELGAAILVKGPGGHTAMPVFLDEDALVRWGGARESSRAYSVPDAARLGMAQPDVGLVVDMASSPGGQPIARPEVELLSKGRLPGADRYRERQDFVRDLGDCASRGSFNADFREKARPMRLFTIGRSDVGREASPGGDQAPGVQLLGVRGPDGGSYCVGWPTPGGSFAFMPEAPQMQVPFGFLVESALRHSRGLVIDPEGSATAIPALELAALWSASS